jgi:hypothetical protein
VQPAIEAAHVQKLLDRAASDPLWKQQLIDEPEAALREDGFFPEFQRIEEMRQQEDAEVSGQFAGTEHGSISVPKHLYVMDPAPSSY